MLDVNGCESNLYLMIGRKPPTLFGNDCKSNRIKILTYEESYSASFLNVYDLPDDHEGEVREGPLALTPFNP